MRSKDNEFPLFYIRISRVPKRLLGDLMSIKKTFKRRTEQDYKALARETGFKWLGGQLPKTTNTKTLWQCPKGHQWQATFQGIRFGHGCPHCRSKDESDYRDLAKERGFEWLGKRVPETTFNKTRWRCSEGHIWLARYADIGQGSGCPECANNAKRYGPDKYHEVGQLAGLKWTGESLPKNTTCKTLWACENGHILKKTFHEIKQPLTEGGGGCPLCSKISEADYHTLAKDRGFLWVGGNPPQTVTDKTLWKCGRGHVWEAKYNNIQNGTGCPVCNESQGEKAVAKILDEFGIVYQREKRFKGCVNPESGRLLPFDFYFIYQEVEFLIEYHGIQHYQILRNNFFGGDDDLKARLYRDKIKADFAYQNGFHLIVIPYTMQDIKGFITERLASITVKREGALSGLIRGIQLKLFG